MVGASFTHCPFNLLWCDANAPRGRLNLHKTNATNEELVIRLSYGREVQGGFRYTDCSYHSNSLSNKMDNSLLAVRDTNHKSIVVGGGRMCTLFEGIARENEIIGIEKGKAEGLYG